MTHEVYARQEGSQVQLRCGVCEETASVSDADLENVNAFLREHKACVAEAA